eukprot:Blabericola_migrator_1__4469@NODE_238_length_10988_cov_97_569087_g202_i0_p4_GENE_NODE_238_length_10988_cov_97_569087_g202_i0NODE_238_length_10988_cov_97_569087_g202_i0_p4_ORF_typecomplete_len264_score49_40Med3/PF11593_8/0_09_NODE_238_length_10988_cov_97_569087_g202_i0205996
MWFLALMVCLVLARGDPTEEEVTTEEELFTEDELLTAPFPDDLDEDSLQRYPETPQQVIPLDFDGMDAASTSAGNEGHDKADITLEDDDDLEDGRLIRVEPLKELVNIREGDQHDVLEEDENDPEKSFANYYNVGSGRTMGLPGEEETTDAEGSTTPTGGSTTPGGSTQAAGVATTLAPGATTPAAASSAATSSAAAAGSTAAAVASSAAGANGAGGQDAVSNINNAVQDVVKQVQSADALKQFMLIPSSFIVSCIFAYCITQ